MPTILPGTQVQARGLVWVVAHTEDLGLQTLLRLRGVSGAVQGLEFDVLHPFEKVEPIITELQPERASSLANWIVYHQAFLLDQALAGEGLVAAQPGRLRLEPFQLVPVLRAIRLSRVRLLLADGVGLGKTVQTGLVLTELIARRMAHRILLVTPSGPLLEQWVTEMLQRFGLRFERLDSAKLAQIRRSTELGANPFDSVPLAIASIDFLKQERVLELLERASYDAVVIDEAHHCMEVGAGTNSREDSLRRRLAQTLASRCDALILATATPHDGNDRSFASLCELLDPSLVDGHGALRGDRFRQHVVRRLKNHILDPVTGQSIFRDRQVKPVPVIPNPAEHPAFMQLQRALVALVAPELRRAFRSHRYHDVLAFIALLKRSVSTVNACVRTLSAVAARFTNLLNDAEEDRDAARQRLRSLRELQKKLDQFGSVSAEEESEQQSLEVEEIAQRLAATERQSRAGGRSVERLASLTESLQHLLALGDAARREDPKLDEVRSQIASIRAFEPDANVLVYTEYTDSQAALIEKLRSSGLDKVLSMNGDDAEEVRADTTNRFRTEEGLVLVSTDAAAEGLNLHQRCHHLLHLELPFNPNRLEQRNGRIDRFGQTADPIVRYLYLRGTFEERILLRLIAKYERQRLSLTFVPNTLGITSDAAGGKLLAGLVEEEACLFEAPPVEFNPHEEQDLSADPATRELLEEIDRSLHGFRQAAQSNAWLGSTGLNAEAALATEAGSARERGRMATNVDLGLFVRNAVLVEGGSARDCGAWSELTLPHAWLQGLDATPGFDSAARVVRLTNDINLCATPDGKEIGFLGRAHPLVRRALDRVRHLSLGGDAAGVDPRVSAIEGDGTDPEILFTYVARIATRAGREFERMLVARCSQSLVPVILPENDNWMERVSQAPGVRAAGLWKQRFAGWGEQAGVRARAAATQAFAPLRERIEQDLRARSEADRSRQAEWIALRAREITGGLAPMPLQQDLFADNAPAAPPPPLADWDRYTDAVERLAGFATDRSQPPHLRSEADLALRIYRQRLDGIEARATVLSAEVLPVGLLMVVPGGRTDMALELQNDCVFSGPALPLPFVKLGLEAELNRLRLLPRSTGDDAAQLEAFWKTYRAHLRQLVSQGGPQRVRNQVVEPLLACPILGYAALEPAGDVRTREGLEDGGGFLVAPDGARLRFWTVALEEDLDAPARRGEAYRFSHARIASRVLLASGERLGLLTNGADLRLLVCDPARLDSHVSISLDGVWKRAREVPDSFRLFVALARPEGVRALPELVEKARLQQAKVTKDLRVQARLAVEEFLQAVLDFPGNEAGLAAHADRPALARALWREGLVTVYRLLFVLKLESTDDPAKCFSFASGSLWRNSFSPGVALAPFARALLDRGEQTGQLLEDGLRTLFRMLEGGLQCTELNVKPMGGSLFAPNATPILSALRWPEHGVARLLDRLLWTTPRRGSAARERVHYGPLDVEDLGRVYEALLELEPGISSEPMCRLRRAKLEVVVPAAQGERYRPATPAAATPTPDAPDDENADDDESEAESEEERGGGKKTKVEWIEAIPPGRFFLRVGLGRKATGSFYTPHSFVRFLVQETLGPLVERASPRDEPRPVALLALKVVDKAMGSGHFLVEVARFLGDALHEACRRCDDLARAADQRAQALRAEGNAEAADAEAAHAADFLRRVEALPDPDDELLRYLPSRAVEGTESGFSQQKAIGLCRRMVAVHCLYGVDKNPLAVGLAKLALWIECHAEGLPLTFLDHRLVVGDSLTGPFFEHLLTFPGSRQPLDDLFAKGLGASLSGALATALRQVRDLESTVGATVADLAAKGAAKARLDRALAPFRLLAAAWSGGVMLGTKQCDDLAYGRLAQVVAETGDLPEALGDDAAPLRAMLAVGLGRADFPACTSREQLLAELDSPACIPALAYDLVFPEVFYPNGDLTTRHGFDADVGNPPWDAIQFKSKEFLAAFDLDVLESPTKRERELVEQRLLADDHCLCLFATHQEAFEQAKRANDTYFRYQKVEVEGDLAGRQLDAFRVFMERAYQLLASGGVTGAVVPSAFHANEGATGVRRLYLRRMDLRCCYSFENTRLLFEIHRSFKFAIVVAEKGGCSEIIRCAFHLPDDEWLFAVRDSRHLAYTIGFIEKTGGEYLTFLEARSAEQQGILSQCILQGTPLGTSFTQWKLTPNTSELPMLGREVFVPLERIQFGGGDPRQPERTRQLNLAGYAPLHEGKTFFQFDDQYGDAIRYAASLTGLRTRPRWLELAKLYRFVYRAISGSGNERTGIAAILPPGTVSTRKAASDVSASRHPTWRSLWLAALFNSFPLDFVLRAMVQTDVSLFIVKRLSAPNTDDTANRLLAHSALRLTCNHAGYEPLWQEQVGEAWRESTPRHRWPVLAGDDARWAVRAAIDAVVAQAYGLTREQYAHVLSTFSHSSYKGAPALCLAAFDELQRDGLEAFTRRHDPYWDIPLNEALPKPVIDLPLPPDPAVHETASAYHAPELFPDLAPTTARRKRRA